MAAENLHQFDQAANEEEPEGGTMTLIEHLEELRRRMIKSLIAVAVCSILGFIFWDRILQFLLLPLPAAANRLPNAHIGQLVAHDIGEPFMVALKLGIAIGIIVASPVLLYQTWGFIAPALTRRERKYAVPFTLLGVGLFFTGLAVGFIVLRYPIDWLVTFGSDRFILLTDADSYFSFVTYFLLAFAIVFELPLVLTFMSVVGIVNSRVLRQKRLVILFGLWFLSCFITPGADPYSPIIIGAAFTILFELSILLMRFIGR
ncbi:MAG TPA: twin-arginine translocase subunit TatC [Ktedonobacterales bacterium]